MKLCLEIYFQAVAWRLCGPSAHIMLNLILMALNHSSNVLNISKVSNNSYSFPIPEETKPGRHTVSKNL